MIPGYDYVEGEAPLPARRCPRCGGPLTQIERGLVAPKSGHGWFRPSRLQPSIWIYRSGDDTARITGASEESGPRTRMRLGPKTA